MKEGSKSGKDLSKRPSRLHTSLRSSSRRSVVPPRGWGSCSNEHDSRIDRTKKQFAVTIIEIRPIQERTIRRKLRHASVSFRVTSARILQRIIVAKSVSHPMLTTDPATVIYPRALTLPAFVPLSHGGALNEAMAICAQASRSAEINFLSEFFTTLQFFNP